MVVNYTQISRITFPVYRVSSGNWQNIDGLLYLEDKIVDDKNMPGATLGIRRLQTPHKDLLPLRHCIDSHVGIIKQRQKHFIDSKGFIFIYEKTKMCEIKYFKIRKVEQKELASLLWLKGVKQPFTIPRPPRLGCSWAGVLHLHGLPWMLYDYAEEEQPLRRRKV